MSYRRSDRQPGKRLRLALILAAICCAAYVALSIGLSRLLDPEELAERLEPQLERATNRDVQIARVDVGLFPLSIDLVDLTVSDPTGMAPALAKATVGIAMGGAGTAVALETADVALMADDLGQLPFAVGLSRASRSIIRQNLGISLGVIGLLIITSVFGLVQLSGAVILHEGITILVVLNALRLLRFKL